MRRKRFEEEVTRLISVYDDDRLMLLTYEMINSGKSNEEILIQMGLDNFENRTNIQFIKIIQSGVQNASFSKADFTEKRKFLLHHVKMIRYDHKKQWLSIEFQ